MVMAAVQARFLQSVMISLPRGCVYLPRGQHRGKYYAGAPVNLFQAAVQTRGISVSSIFSSSL